MTRGAHYATGIAALLVTLSTSVAADEPESWRLGPRIGMSYATGVIGVEIQRQHFGIAAGVVPFCAFGGCDSIETVALKYYLEPEGHSWSIGAFTWFWDEYDGRDNLLGIGIEHRWRVGSGWDLALGLAVGEQGKNVEIVNPMPSLSFGHSF